MKAVILAGGLGTRLRPLTFAVPKPLIPVGERPILEIVIENLKSHGVTDVYLAVGYRAELIETYFQDGRQFGVTIHYSREDKRLGTAGPVRLVCDRFEITEPFLVLNSDIITKLNFADFYGTHLRKGAVITIGFRPYEHSVPYGVVELEEGWVHSISERPKLSFNISCGIYALSPEVLELVPKGEFFDMPDLVQGAVKAGHRIFAYEVREPWMAIENLGDLTERPFQDS